MNDAGPTEAGSLALPVIVRAGVLAELLALLSFSRGVDVDVFHQMALFREALASGALPRHDVFAYGPTLELVVHHEWGTGAVLYAVWQATGWGRGSRRAPVRAGRRRRVPGSRVRAARGATDATMALVGPVAAFLVTIGFYSAVRAQAFTLLFIAVLLVLLSAIAREAARGSCRGSPRTSPGSTCTAGS